MSGRLLIWGTYIISDLGNPSVLHHFTKLTQTFRKLGNPQIMFISQLKAHPTTQN